MEYKILQYQKEVLEKGKVKSLNLIHGEEEFLIKALIDKLKSIYGHNFTLLWGEDTTLEELRESIAEGSMFSSTKERVVLVRGFDAFLKKLGRKKKTLENLLSFLKGIKSSKLFAVVEGKLSPQDISKEPFKTFSAVGDIAVADRLSKKKVRDIVKKKFEREGGGIEEGALDLLVEMCQGNLMVLKHESEKLIAYCEGNKTTEEDVKKVCSPWGEFSLFDFIDSFFAKDVKRCIDSIRDNLSKGVSPLQIIAMLSTYASKLFILHSLLREGESLDKALERLNIKSKFVKIKFKGYLESFSRDESTRLIESLYRLDREIKLSYADPERELLKFTTDFMLK